MINTDHPFAFKSKPNNNLNGISTTVNGNTVNGNAEMVEVNMIDNLESVELNNSSGDDSAKQNRDPPMTELQILIIEAIHSEGGVATFEQIYDKVSKKFDSIKRRDGTPYTSECRRAIQASLSNNPSARPFFKKESRKGAVVWSLAKRSIEFLAEHNNNNSIKPFDDEEEVEEEEEEEEDELKVDAEMKTISTDANSDHSEPILKEESSEEIVDNEDSEEIDDNDEIHDEEYDDEPEDKLKDPKKLIRKDDFDSDKEDDENGQSKKNQMESPSKEERRHLYANRVKRARKIKENAGKRLRELNGNSSGEAKADKEGKMKKKRK